MKQYLTKKTIKRILFVLLALVLLPLPTRCHIDIQPYFADSRPVAQPPVPGEVRPAPYIPDHSRDIYECYAPFYVEFWKHSEWPLEFHWYFLSIVEFTIKAQRNRVYYKSTEVVTIHPSYPVDYSQDTLLLGAAHNVFIGKVLAEASTNDFVGHPATQFTVEVVKNIKGNLKDIVTVNQEGGLKDGTLYLMEDSIGLLQPGATYLLATRYDSEGDFYTLNPHPNASKLLTSDQTASVGALLQLVKGDPKVRALEATYPNEQLIDADLTHGNTRNAFRDLPEEAKATARARAEEARAAMEQDKAQ